MACTESLNTQSWFDGALDANAAREAARHIETCPECTKLVSELQELRTTIRTNATYHRADPALRARVFAGLDKAAAKADPLSWFAWRARQFWAGALSGAVAAGAAAAVVLMLLLPSDADEVIADVSAAHVRSMIGTHLTDVASNDPAVVKRWLTRHGELAPPIADLSSKGYRLIGGRADYVYEGGSGVAVYRRDGHVVNVFAWSTDEDQDLPQSASNAGYNIVFWKVGDVVYCAVSNLAMNDLKSFSAALRGQG